jgi:hypothetical protein
MFKKGLLGYKSVSFAPAITANVLTYFNGKRIKDILLKVKINLRNETSSYLCRPEREQVLRQIE